MQFPDAFFVVLQKKDGFVKVLDAALEKVTAESLFLYHYSQLNSDDSIVVNSVDLANHHAEVVLETGEVVTMAIESQSLSTVIEDNYKSNDLDEDK